MVYLDGDMIGALCTSLIFLLYSEDLRSEIENGLASRARDEKRTSAIRDLMIRRNTCETNSLDN
jgi:hypothetical protein